MSWSMCQRIWLSGVACVLEGCSEVVLSFIYTVIPVALCLLRVRLCTMSMAQSWEGAKQETQESLDCWELNMWPHEDTR